MQFDMKGFDQLKEDFKLLSEIEKKQITKKAILASSRVFRDAVKQTAPVKTGALKRSVSAVSIRANTPIAGVIFKTIRASKKKGKAKITPFYWRFIEYGTSKMPAKPFIRPAFDSSVDKAAKAGFEAYQEEIGRIFK